MKTNQNILRFPKDKLTYCVHCQSTILWYSCGKITLVETATNEVFECMKHGCVLITHTLPGRNSGADEMGLFLMTLIQDGIATNVAEAVALNLINVPRAA